MKYEKKFFAAARDGDVELIKEALAEGFPVDHLSKFGVGDNLSVTPSRSALMWATIHGHLEIIQVLLAAGASPHLREHIPNMEAFSDEGDYRDCWAFAAQYDRLELLEMFLGAADAPKAQHLVDCVEWAAQIGNLRVVKRFVELGLDIESFSSNGTTPLVAAAKNGRLEIVEFLLELGADVNSPDRDYQTPLMAAASKGQAKVVKILLKWGAKIELRDKGQFAGTALHQAVLALGIGIAISRVVDGEWVTEDKGNPIECIRLLIDAGADVNAKRSDGGIPLVSAAGEAEVVRMLIDAGADVDAVDRSHRCTALHWASYMVDGDIETVRCLLEAGAHPSPVDKEGQTPLDIARERDLSEIAKLLEKAGGVLGKETEKGRAILAALHVEELTEEERYQAAAAADEALCPDFSAAVKSKPYKQATKRLEELTDNRHESPENLPVLVQCKVELRRAEELLQNEREVFAELGCTLFRCGRAVFSDSEESLGILPTTDPFEVIAAIGTAGPNYGIFMSEVVAELRELHELFPFHLTQVRYDTIGLEFAKTIPKSKSQKWAVRLYELCPDLIDQGFLTLTKLRKHLEKEKTLTLWWD